MAALGEGFALHAIEGLDHRDLTVSADQEGPEGTWTLFGICVRAVALLPRTIRHSRAPVQEDHLFMFLPPPLAALPRGCPGCGCGCVAASLTIAGPSGRTRTGSRITRASLSCAL